MRNIRREILWEEKSPMDWIKCLDSEHAGHYHHTDDSA